MRGLLKRIANKHFYTISYRRPNHYILKDYFLLLSGHTYTVISLPVSVI